VREQARGKASSCLPRRRPRARSPSASQRRRALEAQGQALRSNDALIQLEFAKRWSGNLPVNMYAGAPLPFLNLTPAEAAKVAR
jgi:hypothetical protein